MRHFFLISPFFTPPPYSKNVKYFRNEISDFETHSDDVNTHPALNLDYSSGTNIICVAAASAELSLSFTVAGHTVQAGEGSPSSAALVQATSHVPSPASSPFSPHDVQKTARSSLSLQLTLLSPPRRYDGKLVQRNPQILIKHEA